MLMGIVAKNSILLVDFAIEEMRAGKDRLTAHPGGGSQARPAHRHDDGRHDRGHAAGGPRAAAATTEFRAPMAIAVIGGLITSTALTLVIVPAAFTLIDDVERWLGAEVRPRADLTAAARRNAAAAASGKLTGNAPRHAAAEH